MCYYSFFFADMEDEETDVVLVQRLAEIWSERARIDMKRQQDIYHHTGPFYNSVLMKHYTLSDCVRVTKNVLEELGMDCDIYSSTCKAGYFFVIPKAILYARIQHESKDIAWIFEDHSIFPDLYCKMLVTKHDPSFGEDRITFATRDLMNGLW